MGDRTDETRVDEDWLHIYWHDPVEGCWVAYRRVDCVGDDEVSPLTLPSAEVDSLRARVEAAEAERDAVLAKIRSLSVAVDAFVQNNTDRDAIIVRARAVEAGREQ